MAAAVVRARVDLHQMHRGRPACFFACSSSGFRLHFTFKVRTLHLAEIFSSGIFVDTCALRSYRPLCTYSNTSMLYPSSANSTRYSSTCQ